MNKANVYLVLFVIASVAEILTPYSIGVTVHFLTKPAIVITLILYYLVTAPQRQTIFLLALIACLLGDILLLLVRWNEIYFLLGLGSFFVAHVLYSFSYRQNRWVKQPDQLANVQRARLSFPILLAGTGLVVFLFPTLGPLRVPVMLYSLVLVIMVLSSISRLGRVSSESFWFVFSGALLFMISDSILAVNKFASPVAHDGLLIMGTYCTAQFLIVEGMIRHK
jgi:uncharacterized membrane protein YhhN